MNQRHYSNETYQLQIDSHMRFVKDWDTKTIKMLHSCDAGEYSVLTTYCPNLDVIDYGDDYSSADLPVYTLSIQYMYGVAWKYFEWFKAFTTTNEILFPLRPFEVSHFSGHFAFSYGHYILNAGYSSPLSYVFTDETF